MTTELKTESGLDEFKIALDCLQFRVKTEQEFIDEFGEKWYNVIGPGWDIEGDGMDEFFGQIIAEKYKLDCFKAIIGIINTFRMHSNNGDFWTFDKSMIIYKVIET